MALPASGAISFNDINVELGVSGTTQVSLNDSGVRTLFGIASGAIDMNTGHGKSNMFTATISSNQTNLNLRTWALANGWGGTSAAQITVGSGVYIYSTSVSNAGLTIDGSWPGGVTLINSGNIMGMGGKGGYGVTNGQSGGSAISLGVNCTITNNSYIGGGGGGGQRPANGADNQTKAAGGGGAGGGQGGDETAFGTTVIRAGGAGGGPGSSGSNGTQGSDANFGKSGTQWFGSGGGGGRIFPGSGGAGAGPGLPAYGSGGGAGGGGSIMSLGGTSGAGGSGGSAGGSAGGPNSGWCGGGGGGWGAAGGSGGGSGGKAIALNGYTATRSGSGTTYGTVA